jgi:hypothetical protein
MTQPHTAHKSIHSQLDEIRTLEFNENTKIPIYSGASTLVTPTQINHLESNLSILTLKAYLKKMRDFRTKMVELPYDSRMPQVIIEIVRRTKVAPVDLCLKFVRIATNLMEVLTTVHLKSCHQQKLIRK